MRGSRGREKDRRALFIWRQYLENEKKRLLHAVAVVVFAAAVAIAVY